MGKDNLYHIIKARKARELERKKAKKSPYERVLIVCEGAKTEPNYFAALRDKLRLNRQNVVIADKRKGLDPKRLVDYALEEFGSDPDFDRVYCVFDKDKHTTYSAALSQIRSKQLKGGASLHSIISIPCFEIWLLIHFIYSTRSYEAPLDNSNAELVIADLKKYLPNYEKGSKSILDKLSGKIETAIEHATRLEKFHETSGTDNPSTKVHLLVQYLQELGSRR